MKGFAQANQADGRKKHGGGLNLASCIGRTRGMKNDRMIKWMEFTRSSQHQLRFPADAAKKIKRSKELAESCNGSISKARLMGLKIAGVAYRQSFSLSKRLNFSKGQPIRFLMVLKLQLRSQLTFRYTTSGTQR